MSDPVAPLFGALLVGATYAVGSRFGARIGLASALVVASSPIFLLQLVQPMRDVPAAALWMAAVAAVTGTRRDGAVVGGVAAAAAMVVRPNLAPLAIPLALFLIWRPERLWRERVRAAATFAACLVPGGLAVALIQSAFYGSPLSSGYPPLETLFIADHIGPNARRYASWLSETQTPLWLLAPAAPFLLPGALTGLLVTLVVVNVACYLPFAVVDDWAYLRFLLPTIPLLMILVIASVDAVCRRIAGWTARPMVALVAVVLVVVNILEAQTRSVFLLQTLESSYERAHLRGIQPPTEYAR